MKITQDNCKQACLILLKSLSFFSGSWASFSFVTSGSTKAALELFSYFCQRLKTFHRSGKGKLGIISLDRMLNPSSLVLILQNQGSTPSHMYIWKWRFMCHRKNQKTKTHFCQVFIYSSVVEKAQLQLTYHLNGKVCCLCEKTRNSLNNKKNILTFFFLQWKYTCPYLCVYT